MRVTGGYREGAMLIFSVSFQFQQMSPLYRSIHNFSYYGKALLVICAAAVSRSEGRRRIVLGQTLFKGL